MVGHLLDPQVGQVDHGDSHLGGGVDVDHVHPDAGPQYNLAALERLDHPPGHGRLAVDHAVGVAGGFEHLVRVVGVRDDDVTRSDARELESFGLHRVAWVYPDANDSVFHL